MWLTNSQRARFLAKELLLHPWHVPSYLAHLPFWGRGPADLELPWWSYSAIQEAKAVLNPQAEVFEFGTGGSTIFFAKRVRSVTAVEDDPAWQECVEQRLRARGRENYTIRLAALPSPDEADPRWEPYVACLDRAYDLIVVDGQDTPAFGVEGEIRTRCFFAAERWVRPGGIIVVDDSWRYPQLRARAKARRFRTFQGVGPCRVGVTSTDFYYY